MFKKSPSRTQRSKGVKIKHILQICLLLGVCFWLVYQVKRSHDKRKEFDEKDVKASVIAQNDDVTLKLGRKDLPRLEEESNREKHEDEDEDDGGVEEDIKREEEREEESNKHVEEEQEEENRTGDGDQEEDDNKIEETEEQVRTDGDDELDERERLAVEGNREEEFLDDEKEREGEDDDEKQMEGNGGQAKEALAGDEVQEERREETENSVDEENHDGEDRSVHEAREEQYRADDASSAVSHDAQIINAEVEKLGKENFNKLEQEQKEKRTEVINGENDSLRLKVEEKQSEGGVLLNVTASVANSQEMGSLNFENGSPPNATRGAELNDQPRNNATELSSEATGRTGEVSTETTVGPLQNGTTLVWVQAQNATETGAATAEQSSRHVDSSSSFSRNNQTDVDPMVINKVGHPDLSAGMNNSRELSNLEESNTSQEGGNVEESNASGRVDGSAGTLDTGTTRDESQHDPIDASDSTLPLEEKDARVDRGTLPDIRLEVGNSEDATAE